MIRQTETAHNLLRLRAVWESVCSIISCYLNPLRHRQSLLRRIQHIDGQQQRSELRFARNMKFKNSV
jgi:hypothetical protein